MNKRLGPIKKWKQNPVEYALTEGKHGLKSYCATTKTADFYKFEHFLKLNYNFSDIKPITAFVCNAFLSATDENGHHLFIKTGHHNGIYENEYLMGHAIYNIDSEHFLKPLYYSDYGAYNFFANEFVEGITLATAIMTDALNNQQKSKIISDIWRIFCALRTSDIVHRDIRPDNLMLVGNRLVLIDFQLAVSKTNYVELEYLSRRPNRLRKLGNKKFKYRPFTWDDAYSLLKVMEFVGRNKFYGLRYDIIHKNIKEYVGVDKIHATHHEKSIDRMVRHIKTLRI